MEGLGESVAEASASQKVVRCSLNEGLFRGVTMHATSTQAREDAAKQAKQLLPRACRPQRPVRAPRCELTGTASALLDGGERGSSAGVHGCGLDRSHGRPILATPVATQISLLGAEARHCGLARRHGRSILATPMAQRKGPAALCPQSATRPGFVTPNVRHERRDAAGEACRGTSARWRG
jgi:hypothetical protein